MQKKYKKLAIGKNLLLISPAIQCPQPVVPLNGKIDSTSGAFGQRKYAVGALLTFSCNEGYAIQGERGLK
jgi:hypothetical protein